MNGRCELALPDNCRALAKGTYECGICHDGFYLADSECHPCDLDMCETCEAAYDDDGIHHPSCTLCAGDFVVRTLHDDYISYDVCDWVDYLRVPDCKISNLYRVDDCLQCRINFFWSESQRRCLHCSQELTGCSLCSHDGRACHECLPDFQMKETEAACWQPHCAVFDQYIPDRCARCEEGYFLEWDTGECVEHCSDGYDTDFRLMRCTEDCDEYVQYHD